MTHVATLIAGASDGALDPSLLERAQAMLPGAAAPQWLAEKIAADIPFSANGEHDDRALADRLRANAGDRPVDVVVQPLRHRRKRLLVADMDSTMIGQECIDELADFAGVKDRVAAITERAMRGDIAFEPALRERIALLSGLSATVIDEVIANRVRPTSGAQTLVATMRAHGAYTCLVSGGFTVFTGHVAAILGFDEHHANTLLVDRQGRIASIAEPILGREAKLDTLLAVARRRGLAMEQTLAVGDGANDIPMLEASGLGVAYHAKPKVAERAAARIDHGDLTALLYLQGYRQDEFVTE